MESVPEMSRQEWTGDAPEIPKKRSHAGLWAFLAVVLILMVGIAVVVIRLYPTYKAADCLARNLDLENFSYSINVTLDRDKLEKNQDAALNFLALATGIDRASLDKLTVEGSVDGDIIFAAVYPEGQKTPLLELYLSDGADVVKASSLYHKMRENFCSQNALLSFLIPEWNDHEYISLEQVEQLFGADMSALRRFRIPVRDRKFSVRECFAVLILMDRIKTDTGAKYTFSAEGLEAGLTFREKGGSELTGEFAAERPAEIMEGLDEKLSGFRIDLKGERDKLRMLERIAGVIEPGKGKRLQVPSDLVSQDTVESIAAIRAVIEDLTSYH